ncbi:MAG: mechanosensitive ion channel family protein [Myxococcales bacterium]
MLQRPPLLPFLALCASILLWLTPSALADDHAPEAPSKKAVTLHEAHVFYLYRGEGALSLDERAQHASQALSLAAGSATEPEVHVEEKGEVATVLAGPTPIVELREEDAHLAGDSSLKVHVASVASRVTKAIEGERRRVSLANTVFSISLVVFFGLITVYLVGRVSELGVRARRYVSEHPEKIPALRLQRLDVIGAASVRNGFLVFLGLGRWAAMFGLAYAWLVLSLSLFESTRPYTEKLTGIVLSPLTALVGRVASALPLFAIVLAAAALLGVMMRIADLFFQSVDRGETHVGWLARETALSAGLVVRLGITLFALIIVGPVITGDADGSLSRIGMVLLVAIAIAAVPSLASIIAGISTVFSRSLGLGDLVEYGGERGHVKEIGLVSLTLEGDHGIAIRVPHARSLWHATRVVERRQR